MAIDEEKHQKIIKKGLLYPTGKIDLKHITKEPTPPKENLLHVFMGGVRLLIPDTSEYKQYDGLETGALASCTGFALYIPRGKEVILGIAHLAPFQGIYSVIEGFSNQLREAGIDLYQFKHAPGFMEVIPGQITYDKDKSYLRDKIKEATEIFRRQFPNLRGFPFDRVTYSVLAGHLSFSVKVLKDGRLSILGEGRTY